MNHITDYSIASELFNYATNPRKQGRLSLSCLEDYVFGGIESNQSVKFWTDCIDGSYDKDNSEAKFKDYVQLLFAFFIAMTDEEIYEIRECYFKDNAERIDINRSAM